MRTWLRFLLLLLAISVIFYAINMPGSSKGGKRDGAGRKNHGLKNTDFAKYKAPSKKKINQYKKDRLVRDITGFLTKPTVVDSNDNEPSMEISVDELDNEKRLDNVEQTLKAEAENLEKEAGKISDEENSEAGGTELNKETKAIDLNKSKDKLEETPEASSDQQNVEDDRTNKNTKEDYVEKNVENGVSNNNLSTFLQPEERNLFRGQCLEFFKNGFFATTKQERRADSEFNFTCAPDSLLSIVESLLISDAGPIFFQQFGEHHIIQQAAEIVSYRIRNNWKWTHQLQDSFWDELCRSFPSSFLPQGTIRAAVDEAMSFIGELGGPEVVVHVSCRKCRSSLGNHLVKLGSLWIVNFMSNNSSTLLEQTINRLQMDASYVISREVRCSQAKCNGIGVSEFLGLSSIKFPIFLILNTQVVSDNSNNRCNGFSKSSCAEETLSFDDVTYQLRGAIISQSMHFFAVTKLGSSWYNLNNMDRAVKKKPYSTFRSAYQRKNVKEKLLPLDRPSTVRHGGVGYLVYELDNPTLYEAGQEFKERSRNAKIHVIERNSYVLESDVSPDLPSENNNIDLTGSDDANDDTLVQDQFVESLNVSNDTTTEPESKTEEYQSVIDSFLKKRVETECKDDGENFKNDTDFCKEADQDSTEAHPLTDDEDESRDDENVDKFVNQDSTEAHSLTDDEDEERDNDEKEDNEEKDMDMSGDFNENNVDMEEDSIQPETYKARGVDYRLQSWQEIGRKMDDHKGAYIEHSSGQWFCYICKAMAPATSHNRRWIDVGVSLGKSPSRVLERHFSSVFHENCVKKSNMLDEASLKGKEKNIIKLLQEMSMTSEERNVTKNREFVKVCFRVASFLAHSVFPNKSFESLVELIAYCGSESIKEHLLTCARNATYTSAVMFAKYLEVLSNYTEQPLLNSLQLCKFFTLFHDETTDLQKHSQAAIFVMFPHQDKISEHFLGLVNMTSLGEGLSAKDLFTGIDKKTEEKGIDLRKNAFSETDAAPVNEGDVKGLKTYFVALNPHHIHEKCNSHGLALIFKHLITKSEKYNCIEEADRLMGNLYTFFNDSSLRIAVFERIQIALGLQIRQLIYPSATRWLSHCDVFLGQLNVIPR